MPGRFSFAAIVAVGWAIASAWGAGITFSDRAAFEAAIVSPRVAIAEGAHFRGSVDMQRKTAQVATPAAKPAAAAATPAAATPAAAPQPAVRVGV